MASRWVARDFGWVVKRSFPPSTIIRTQHPDPYHSNVLIRLGQYPIAPSSPLNGSRNYDLLFANSVKKEDRMASRSDARDFGRVA